MGHTADFKCKKCKNIFEADEGGTFAIEAFRCEKCDMLQGVERGKKPPEKCKCDGKFRNDLKPMCKKCKSRNVEIVKIKMNYD